MTDSLTLALAKALQPLIDRVRTDVTAVKRQDGRQAWTDQPLTAERLIEHLTGGTSRGVSQLSAGSSTTRVALLDFDSHKGEASWSSMSDAARRVCDSIALLGGSPIVFRSSGGRGIHVYVLWDEPQDAYSVRQWLIAALRSEGYENGVKGVAAREVEVFPKQNSVPIGGYGNQAILPLSGASAPLVWGELEGELVAQPRAAVLAMSWPVSEPVPVLEAPVYRARVSLMEIEQEGLHELISILDTIPNSGEHELDYDRWRDVIFAVHHETAGSAAGLALANRFSARAGKYDAAFLDERVWPFIRSEGRERAIGLGTLKRMAGAHGWHEPLSADAFSDVSADDSRPPTEPVEWDEGGGGGGGGGGRVGSPEQVAEQVAMNALARQMLDNATRAANPPVTPSGELYRVDAMTGDMTLPDAPLVVPLAPPVPPAPPTPLKLLAKIKRRTIPEALHLTTDQANAQRLKNSVGSHVFVAAGKWHVWDGRRWHADESDVYRYACRLSDLVKAEAAQWKARGTELAASQNPAEVEDGKRRLKVAEALGKWGLKCEMKGTIEAAIGLARKMLTLETENLDRDPDLLNCLNGTVDLRTGVLHKHDPSDFITKLVPVRYMPDAECPRWLRALDEISGGVRPLVDFLQRWFGYCLSGRTTEQAFAVLHGPGGNGKSLVVEMMVATMGEYAGTAAPGLLVATKGADRHPTEIAALFGRRMVTAHESGEGVVLREDFVKQATGGDKLTARYMREDFFEFTPTHKIQLLTNHKPGVKGQDAGIWRRVMLVPFEVTFGTVGQVEAGTHARVKDAALLERLQGELEGALAWRVRGAVEWYRAGLQPPAVVRAASDAYKSEQDRVGQFVAECCELGVDFEEVLSGAGGTMASHDGLYPAYVSWCKESGVFPLSKMRFTDDVVRVVPRGEIVTRKVPVGVGRRREVRAVRGLRLLLNE